MKKLIGVDIGGTKCAVLLGAINDRGEPEILEKVRFEMRIDLAPSAVISQIESCIASFGEQGIEGIGISCGGPLDPKQGVILSPPNLPLWDRIPITSILSDRFGVPAALQNDADACALAEWKFGAGRGVQNMIFLTFGTGFGAGLILNGKLYSGAGGMAGEIGHIRVSEQGPAGYGKTGSLEGFCSGGGIRQLGYTLGLEAFQNNRPVAWFDPADPESCNAKAIAEAAQQGDQTALDVYRMSGEVLGKGLSILIDLLNPEMIVIGSIFARSQDLLWPHAKRVIDKEVLPPSGAACAVVPAALGEMLGDYAALAAAVNE